MDNFSRSASCFSVGLAAAGVLATQTFVMPAGQAALRGTTESPCGSQGTACPPPCSGSSIQAAAPASAALLLATHGARRVASARRATAPGRAGAFDPAAQVGVVAPLGFFDPLGFAKEGDAQGFRVLRAAELKHGRLAMLASIGLVGQHFLKLPGAEKVPAGLAALNTPVGLVGIGAIFAWSAVMERVWKDDERREPGNFGDPFGVGMYTNEMRNKELSNGRFAMIAVLGIIAAELATGKDAIEQFGF